MIVARQSFRNVFILLCIKRVINILLCIKRIINMCVKRVIDILLCITRVINILFCVKRVINILFCINQGNSHICFMRYVSDMSNIRTTMQECNSFEYVLD